MKLFRGIAGFLPHLLLTFGIMLLTFYCITLVNEAMCFLSSFLSQKFEMLYACAALLTAAAAFAQKHARMLALAEAVCSVALAVPAVICTVQHRMDMLDTEWFRIFALVNAAVSIVFSVLLIVMQRRTARAAWASLQQKAS